MKEKVTKHQEHQKGRQSLSKREEEVMKCIVRGLQPRQIALELSINAKTVNTYRTRILRKLDLKSTGDIVRYSFMG